MSKFDDDFARVAAPATAEYFGAGADSALYQPPGTGKATVVSLSHVIVGPEVRRRRKVAGGYQLFAMRHCIAYTDETAAKFCGLKKFANNGRFTFGGKEYRIDDLAEESGRTKFVAKVPAGEVQYERRQDTGRLE